ncbi:MAG: glycosyltransferase family 1 protein, partial [Candidatus Levybacteria bacterium]|nr:glycosyltransferase family 1 protein [Candidatus Levybacteria bacterium]
MKIGIDCRLWNETGVGRYTRNLVFNLQKIDRKNEYVLFVLSKDYDQISQLSFLNSHLVRTDIRWHTIAEQFYFPKILNRENLDLMHFAYFSVPLFYNKPFVVTIHDLIVNHFSTGSASTLPLPIYKIKLLGYKAVMYMAAKRAKKVITVSNATKEEIVDHLRVDENKVVVTYEGVDDKISNLKLQIPNKSQNTKYKILNTKYFLYVGNAFPHKNLERLMDAFSVSCQGNDTKLILVGKDDYFYKKLRKKVEDMKLDGKVIFLQNISDQELSDLYNNSLALVSPSLMEGFGLPALEAMANKCLVLSSDIPALKEICGDAAIYFDPYNIKDMAKKMNEVHSNDTYYYSDKKGKGLERIKLFSWQKMA